MPLSTAATGWVESPKELQPAKALNALEIEMIDLFVQFSRILGQPKSVAEIYGLLFVSTQPLTIEETMDRFKSAWIALLPWLRSRRMASATA